MTLDERRLTSVTIPASVLKPVCTLFSAKRRCGQGDRPYSAL